MFSAKLAALDVLSKDRPKDPLKLAFAAIKSSSDASSVLILPISWRNSTIAESVTPFLTLAEAPNVLFN